VLVYLNGKFVPQEEATISVEDRAFLFADGVYEVVRIVRGRPLFMDEHLERLARGLRELRIDFAGVGALAEVARRLVEENALQDGEATLYIQVSRGAAPRKHAFPPEGTPPTVYAAARPLAPHPESHFAEGVATITVPDTRWARCDIKSVALLPNVLANQQAKERGAFEALFVKDGVLLEGSLSNLFAVIDGVVTTYPTCNYILPGITRDAVLAIARQLGLPTAEAPIFLHRLPEVEELFLTGTTADVTPVVSVDGRKVGAGEPGPISRRLLAAYRELL
jgi:D-alanine transaminase